MLFYPNAKKLTIQELLNSELNHNNQSIPTTNVLEMIQDDLNSTNKQPDLKVKPSKIKTGLPTGKR